jgi:AcrR family transcriptional regulator
VPRLIDHQARRAELAEAVWRVVASEGVTAVSVRRVAAEAGVSAGSLRHVLPTKGALLAAALELVVERATERFLARAQDPVESVADVVRLLGEMLPLDDERRLELRTHLGLVVESAGHPELGTLRRELDDAVSAGCRGVLEVCRQADLVADDLDLDREAERLHVLIDGLALHLLGPAPRISPAQAADLLTEHVAGLR